MEFRIEKDTIGKVKVPKHVLWGPQTQRSINNFKIGIKIMESVTPFFLFSIQLSNFNLLFLL